MVSWRKRWLEKIILTFSDLYLPNKTLYTLLFDQAKPNLSLRPNLILKFWKLQNFKIGVGIWGLKSILCAANWFLVLWWCKFYINFVEKKVDDRGGCYYLDRFPVSSVSRNGTQIFLKLQLNLWTKNNCIIRFIYVGQCNFTNLRIFLFSR